LIYKKFLMKNNYYYEGFFSDWIWKLQGKTKILDHIGICSNKKMQWVNL